MDRVHRRVGKNKWVPRTEVSTLKDHLVEHGGYRRIYLIGTGPSVDFLVNGSKTLDPNIPIFAINKATKVLKHVTYTVVTDALDLGIKTDSIVLAHEQCAHLYDPCITFTNEYLGTHFGEITAINAIHIANKMGVDEIIAIGFDAYLQNKYTYANSIGRAPDISRYQKHGLAMIAACAKLGIKLSFLGWSYNGKDEPLREHLEEHHVPLKVQSLPSDTSLEDSSSDEQQVQHEQTPDHSGSLQLSLDLGIDDGTTHHKDPLAKPEGSHDQTHN